MALVSSRLSLPTAKLTNQCLYLTTPDPSNPNAQLMDREPKCPINTVWVKVFKKDGSIPPFLVPALAHMTYTDFKSALAQKMGTLGIQVTSSRILPIAFVVRPGLLMSRVKELYASEDGTVPLMISP